MRKKGKGPRERGKGYLNWRDKEPPLDRGETDTGKWRFIKGKGEIPCQDEVFSIR